MQCDYIVSITIIQGSRGQGDAELEASFNAVAKKYASKPAKLLNVKLIQNTLETKADETLDKIVDDLGALGDIESAGTHVRAPNTRAVPLPGATEGTPQSVSVPLVRTHGGIGLYWACHGDSESTDPSATALAGWTAKLYAKGLRFVKINYNSCNSAGANDKFVPSSSSLQTFCDELQSRLGADAATKLTDLAVAGYTTTVELVDREEQYYKGLTPKPDYDKIGEGIHNVAVSYPAGKPRQYQRLAPDLEAEHVYTKGEAVAQAAAGFRDAKGTQVNKTQRALNKAITDFKKTKEYMAILSYIQRKPILVFTGSAWQKRSIADFTDNQNIFEMVQFVEAANRFSSEPSQAKETAKLLAALVP